MYYLKSLMIFVNVSTNNVNTVYDQRVLTELISREDVNESQLPKILLQNHRSNQKSPITKTHEIVSQ